MLFLLLWELPRWTLNSAQLLAKTQISRKIKTQLTSHLPHLCDLLFRVTFPLHIFILLFVPGEFGLRIGSRPCVACS